MTDVKYPFVEKPFKVDHLNMKSRFILVNNIKEPEGKKKNALSARRLNIIRN